MATFEVALCVVNEPKLNSLNAGPTTYSQRNNNLAKLAVQQNAPAPEISFKLRISISEIN